MKSESRILFEYPDEKPTMSGAFVEILEDINRGEY